MCVSEIWTYKECGCHFKHDRVCGAISGSTATYQLATSASASGVESSVEKWLLESGSDGGLQPQSRLPTATPGNPKQCPHYVIRHKSFLEQICDDCVVEEMGVRPLVENSRTLQDSQYSHRMIPAYDHGIGDTDSASRQLCTPFEDVDGYTVDDSLGRQDGDADPFAQSEDAARILESHVEVTISKSSNPSTPDQVGSSVQFSSHSRSSSKSSASTNAETFGPLKMSLFGPNTRHLDQDSLDDLDEHPECRRPDFFYRSDKYCTRGRTPSRNGNGFRHIDTEFSWSQPLPERRSRLEKLRTISTPFRAPTDVSAAEPVLGNGLLSQPQTSRNLSPDEGPNSGLQLSRTRSILHRFRSVELLSKSQNQTSRPTSTTVRTFSGTKLRTWTKSVISNLKPSGSRGNATPPVNASTIVNSSPARYEAIDRDSAPSPFVPFAKSFVITRSPTKEPRKTSAVSSAIRRRASAGSAQSSDADDEADLLRVNKRRLTAGGTESFATRPQTTLGVGTQGFPAKSIPIVF